jgi:membrane protease YdiL (CAAX protease family)
VDAVAEAAPRTPRDPAWNFWDVVMIALVFLAGMVVFGLLITGALMLLGVAVPKEMSPLLVKLMLGAQCLAYIGVLLFMRHLVTADYGRRFADAVRWTAPAPAFWSYYLVGGVTLAFAVGLLGRILPFPAHLPIDKYFQDPTSAWLLTIFGVSLAPLVEELFFRGFFYPVVARRLGIPIGAILTALGFALMHASQLDNAWGPLLVLFLVGMALTIARILTGSVVPGLLMHIGYNGTLFTLLYLASDGFRHLDKVLQQ